MPVIYCLSAPSSLGTRSLITDLTQHCLTMSTMLSFASRGCWRDGAGGWASLWDLGVSCAELCLFPLLLRCWVSGVDRADIWSSLPQPHAQRGPSQGLGWQPPPNTDAARSVLTYSTPLTSPPDSCLRFVSHLPSGWGSALAQMTHWPSPPSNGLQPHRPQWGMNCSLEKRVSLPSLPSLGTF